MGYQQITSLAAATSLTVPQGAIFALIITAGAAVRWRDDSGIPTASVGMPIPINSGLEYSGDLGKIKFIQQTAGAVLNVAYYR